MLIEGAEEKREMGEFCMEMRGEDGARRGFKAMRWLNRVCASACVCMCVIGGLVLLCQGNA